MAYAAFKARWPQDEKEAGIHGDAPARLAAELEESMTELLKNLKADRNMDGIPWEAETSRSNDRVKVWRSTAKGSKSWRIKCQGLCDNAATRTVYEQICLNENKMQWDKESIGWARRFKCFKGSRPGDRIDIESYISLPHLGGLVKPRAFVEGRLTRFLEDGSILSSVIAIDPAAPYAAQCDAVEFDALARKAGLARARNMVGSGMGFYPEGSGARFVMLMQTELGGWLPVGPVNNAGGEVLAGIADGCIKQVAKIPRERKTPTPTSTTSGHSISDSIAESTPAPTAAGEDSFTSTGTAGRVRRRIRPPGCREEEAYAWRWMAMDSRTAIPVS
eukprot:TRINITY_DN4465_c0_g2_i1.p2 TRINITY_DN4465_c0_g2~~TRINITY_DN4465_c0_g2_i1.p2  ORF type:complete len:358 (+),score=123.87 TRINITY_DN4465_c0_g2_i1:77-1075(+)